MNNYGNQMPKEQEPHSMTTEPLRVPAMADLIKQLVNAADGLSTIHQILKERLSPFCRAENLPPEKADAKPIQVLPDALNEIRTQIQRLKDVEDGLRSLRNRLEI